MKRCQICKGKTAWIWQPTISPGKARQTFARPGYHYRGYMAVCVCDHCRERIKAGENVSFRRRGITWWLQGNDLVNETMAPYQ